MVTAKINYKIRILKTLQDIEQYRAVWQKMLDSEPYPAINADINRYLSVLKASENKPNPLILLLEQNDHPKAMVIGRREKISIPVRLGYKTIFKPKLNAMTVVYGGILGQPDKNISLLLIKELKKLLKRKGIAIDVVYFNHLEVDSIFYRQLRKKNSFVRYNHFPINEPHWIIEIPDSVDEFEASLSRKRRGEFRRLIKKLRKNNGDKLEIKEFHIMNEVEIFLNIAKSISKQSFKNSINAGLKNDSVTKQCIFKDVNLNRWWGRIMFVAGEPCAYVSGSKYHNIFFIETIGYDTRWASYSPGKLLLYEIFKLYSGKGDIAIFDFGFGDAEYKKRFCRKTWLEAKATYVFSPSAYPLLINLICSLNSAITVALIWIAQKTGIYQLIKRK